VKELRLPQDQVRMQTPGGQTLNDRILAARHSLAGQGLAKAVCKATTEEIIGPKKKHLDYLLQCTNEPNVSIPTLANLLIERTLNPNWVVVYKSLITIHHLMCYGNERFTQYLASSNSNFQLANFLDKTGVQGGGSTGPIRGYDMSPFIRRYAKYLSEKSGAYRGTAMDFCKVKRGKDGGALRTMGGDKLLKTMPILQNQVDALLEFDCTATDLNNGVINACFMLLFRDLIRLFACYNDGIINLLEKYFEMGKKQTRDALDLYKKFLIRMDRVAEFLKVAESVGIEKTDIPDLAKAPSSLLEALEGHLANLEGRKPGSGGTTPTQGGHNAFGSAAANGGNIDDKTAQQLMNEEAAAMEKFRAVAPASNPFASGPAPASEETPNILDLFGVSAEGAAPAPGGATSDDLLQLSGNPFANMLNAAGGPPTSAPMFQATTAPGSAFPPQSSSSSQFVSDSNFANVFGQDEQAPVGISPLMTSSVSVQGLSASGGKLVTGDLDSSLANLASNLNFGPASNRHFPSNGSRGPPMATASAGFGAFPQQQQAMGQFDITSAAPPAGSPALAPGAASTQQPFSSPFPNQANLSLGASQIMSPITSQDSFQQNSFMNTSASLNNIDLFNSSSKPPFGGAKTPFGDFGNMNGGSPGGGQFLNNNGMPPMKPHGDGVTATDQFGLL